MNSEVCHAHSGVCKELENLAKDNVTQWGKIGTMNNRIDSIMTRLNILLGAVVVELVVLIITKIV